MAYDESFIDLLAIHCDISFSFADGNGLHNYYNYFFSYDCKSRLIKVQKQVNIVGGEGYDLSIDYDDQDNVTELSYVQTPGSRDIIRVIATGYDEKVNLCCSEILAFDYACIVGRP